MSSLQECAAQLNQLAEKLPYGAVGHVSTELEQVGQQVMQIVQGTGHEQTAGQIMALKEQMVQQLTDQLGMIRNVLETTAAAVLGR
ncbi:hypothetical protein [Actinokineospora xionganensis]|uniref:Uncharacterized protein n=1 Tax=Actinokineospora xionganensis TaxID=2684470 RepID=A0ABR7LF93_9PSEU|nr:hypothetical protein [Actinokineospora xionganensis]MBC6451310.1 hypothetical protein [Actinokineospora xionganensis]